MRHPHGLVMLLINGVCYQGNGMLWYYFFDEDYSSSPFTFVLVANIKPEVDLFKVSVKWDREAEQTCVDEHEPYQAYVAGIIP